MAWAILDTNVYIGHWERGLYQETLAEVRQAFIVRHSAVVISELRRGGRNRTAPRVVENLLERAPVVWTPQALDRWGRARHDVGSIVLAIEPAAWGSTPLLPPRRWP